jgi:hypothetical protein
MRTINKTISTTVPLNANFSSPYQQLKSIYMYTMAAIITGTPTGTISIQASNDPETNDTQTNIATVAGQSSSNPPSKAPINWVTITNSTFVVTTAGETMWNVRDIGYNYVRVQYIDSSGGASTATMTIIFNGKGE